MSCKDQLLLSYEHATIIIVIATPIATNNQKRKGHIAFGLQFVIFHFTVPKFAHSAVSTVMVSCYIKSVT